MKKKILLIMGTIIIVLVMGTVLGFVLGGRTEEKEESFLLKGTWLIYQHGENTIQNEFMVFTDFNVSDYRNGNKEPVASSTYSINGSLLNMPDIKKSFSVQFISENNVILTETNTIVWRLLKVGNENIDTTSISPQAITGIYDVKVVGEESRFGETMTFTENHMSFVQAGKETIASDYFISKNGILHLTDIKRDYYVFMNESNLFFIGVEDNGVWELFRQ